jgi:transposase
MISFSGSLKIFLLVDCCDMRKGFNGLYGLVSSSFGEDPRSGALYVFTNRRHSRIKVLYFDGTGLWLLSKRLERGTGVYPILRKSGADRALSPVASLVRGG